MEIQSTGSRNRRRGRIVPLLGLIAIAVAPVIQAAEDPLIMGVFPRSSSAETGKLFTPMSDYLGERLGRKVTDAGARRQVTREILRLQERDVAYWRPIIRELRELRSRGLLLPAGSRVTPPSPEVADPSAPMDHTGKR